MRARTAVSLLLVACAAAPAAAWFWSKEKAPAPAEALAKVEPVPAPAPTTPEPVAEEATVVIEEETPTEAPPAPEKPPHFWYNDVSGLWMWHDPKYKWTNPEGRIYYWDPDTRTTSWDKPNSLQWRVVEEEEEKVYVNDATGAKQEATPEMLAWRRVPSSEPTPSIPEGLEGAKKEEL
eukprot:scaffold6.g2767.t1